MKKEAKMLLLKHFNFLYLWIAAAALRPRNDRNS
jgi:hypothetical protein